MEVSDKLSAGESDREVHGPQSRSGSCFKPERNRRLPKYQYTWDNDNKLNFKQTGYEGVDLINLAKDWDQWRALVDMVMNLRVQ
jgi:hypothetical protein